MKFPCVEASCQRDATHLSGSMWAALPLCCVHARCLNVKRCPPLRSEAAARPEFPSTGDTVREEEG